MDTKILWRFLWRFAIDFGSTVNDICVMWLRIDVYLKNKKKNKNLGFRFNVVYRMTSVKRNFIWTF